MLKQITDRLSASIYGIVQKQIPLATQRTTSDGKTFPAIYKGQGQYSEINIDNYAGLCYFRTNGKVQVSEFNELKRPLNDLKRYEYQLRLVVCVQNSTLGTDNEFTPDSLALTFVKQMQEVNGVLKQDLEANFTIIQCKSYDTDAKDILAEEYAGIERLKNSVPYTYSLIAIDLTVDVVISDNCIQLLCKDYCS